MACMTGSNSKGPSLRWRPVIVEQENWDYWSVELSQRKIGHTMCKANGEPPKRDYKTQHLLLPHATSAESAKDGELVVEQVALTFGGYTYRHSRIAYIKGRNPVPVVLVHPNYAGLKQFDIDQAVFLALAGYVGFALDLYREDEDYQYKDRNPKRNGPRELSMRHFIGAFKHMNQMLRSPIHWRGLMKAYLDHANTHPAVAVGRAGAIGYCFGGQCLLEQVRAGHALQAVVSFHGLLQSFPTHRDDPLGRQKGRLTAAQFAEECKVAPNRYSTECKVLIENGDLDDHVTEANIQAFKEEMDSQGIDWRINNHAQTKHGFALSEGVWSHEYKEDADRRSTLTMLSLFAEVWPDVEQHFVELNACGTHLGQMVLPRQQAANIMNLLGVARL